MLSEPLFRKKVEEINRLSAIPGTTFSEVMKEMFRMKRWNAAKFSTETGLSRETYSDLRSKKGNPKIATILTVCMGMKLPFDMTEKLLVLAGCPFKPGNPAHNAYKALALHCVGASLDDCNKLLRSAGIVAKDLLGSAKTRRH